MCQETDFRVGQQRNMLLCFLPGPGFCKMTFNPGLLFLKKTGDLCIGNTQGGPNEHLFLPDLYAERFPPAANDFDIFHRLTPN